MKILDLTLTISDKIPVFPGSPHPHFIPWEKIKEILDGENNIQYEIQGVYGVYDIILKLSSDDINTLRSTITNKIRKITSVQSTLTMMVIEGQE